MINLDQVRTLEWKVKQAVQLIVHLRRENDTLRSRLTDTEVRLQDLEALLESFKATQSELESGIRSALEDLDNLEAGSSPQETGPVDALSYPPEVVEAAPAFAAEDPAALFDKAPEVAPVAVTHEPTFEEEYAALAAAEAAELEGSDVEAAVSEVVPESVELEDAAEDSPEDYSSEEESRFLEPEEKQPEQPGLGIF